MHETLKVILMAFGRGIINEGAELDNANKKLDLFLRSRKHLTCLAG
jgi:hypothetical protein